MSQTHWFLLSQVLTHLLQTQIVRVLTYQIQILYGTMMCIYDWVPNGNIVLQKNKYPYNVQNALCTYTLLAYWVYGPSQKELQQHPCRPRHLFNSVTDLLTSDACKVLNEVTDYEKLRSFSRKSGNVLGHAHCLMHGQRCVHLRAGIHVAGIPCISWSPMGASRKTSGGDYPLFISWVCLRRQYQEISSHKQDECVWRNVNI